MEEIKFGTDGWRATLDIFTLERVGLVGDAIAAYLESVGHDKKVVVIIHDARETSPGFAKELGEKITTSGYDVIYCDRDCPTPIAAWTVIDKGLAGAIVVTASHNPPEYNGIKFIPSNGSPALPEVTDSLENYIRNPIKIESDRGKIRIIDIIEPYTSHVRHLVNKDLNGIKIVYDSMHGSGRGITDELLRSSGAEVISIRNEIDPNFGGGSPEPKEENLKMLINAIKNGDGEIGIANDGDADRVAVVTRERGCLDGNLLFAVLYEYLLELDKGPAVRTVSTTYLIDKIAESHGQYAVEVPVGFKWVAQAMKSHDALFGGEDSGGFSMRGHVREKDGVLIAQLAAAANLGKPLDDRIDLILEKYGEIHNLTQSIFCQETDKKEILSRVYGKIGNEFAGEVIRRVNDTDGVKVLLENGSWALMRPSGTEPKMRIYTEGNSMKIVEELVRESESLIRDCI